MLQCSGTSLVLAYLLSTSLGPAICGAAAGLSLCLSTTSASPRNTMIPGAWCPWSQQASLPEQNEWWGVQCGIFIQTSHRRIRFPPAWDHQYSSFVPSPCSLLKFPSSNPAVYFRRCQAVSLSLFMASNVFPFTAYFRCNKREMKGPLKENALPCHYLLCGMYPELLLNECWLFPCTICLVTYRMLSLLAGAPFLGWFPTPPACSALRSCPKVTKRGDAGACGWGQLQPKWAAAQVRLQPYWARPAGLSPYWKAWQSAAHSWAFPVATKDWIL